MTQLNRGFLPNDTVEELTSHRLGEYERKVGKPVVLPVPVGEVIEHALDLCIPWGTVNSPNRVDCSDHHAKEGA